MSNVLDQVVRDLQNRVTELEPVVAEAQQLEAALSALGGTAKTAPASKPPRKTISTGSRSAKRAPRGKNREAILTTIEERPGVSVGEIAAVTKIAKPTVASTVSKLKRDGVLEASGMGVRLTQQPPE